jgi:hypothetical protein
VSAPVSPFIVIHRLPPEHDGATGRERRWACETLPRALDAVERWIREVQDAAPAWNPTRFEMGQSPHWPHAREILRRITESGGSISLPDGSEIVVEATTWRALGAAVAQVDGFKNPASAGTLIRWAEDGGRSRQEARDTVLAAYNARFGTAAQEQRVIYEDDPTCDSCAQLKTRTAAQEATS